MNTFDRKTLLNTNIDAAIEDMLLEWTERPIEIRRSQHMYNTVTAKICYTRHSIGRNFNVC